MRRLNKQRPTLIAQSPPRTPKTESPSALGRIPLVGGFLNQQSTTGMQRVMEENSHIRYSRVHGTLSKCLTVLCTYIVQVMLFNTIRRGNRTSTVNNALFNTFIGIVIQVNAYRVRRRRVSKLPIIGDMVFIENVS